VTLNVQGIIGDNFSFYNLEIAMESTMKGPMMEEKCCSGKCSTSATCTCTELLSAILTKRKEKSELEKKKSEMNAELQKQQNERIKKYFEEKIKLDEKIAQVRKAREDRVKKEKELREAIQKHESGKKMSESAKAKEELDNLLSENESLGNYYQEWEQECLAEKGEFHFKV
jgi:predicted ribosome quality control (RQC) complex YloA/Tae2 family protein